MDYFFAFRLFILLITSLYVYGKILDVKDLSRSKKVAGILFSLIMSIPISFLPPLLFEFLFIGSVCIFVAITARVKTSLMISSVVISIGISLGIDNLTHLLYATVITPIEFFYVAVTDTPLFYGIYQGIFMTAGQSILFIMLIAFMNFLFRIKRLQKGILFWENKEAVRLGILFSILTMLSMSMRGIAVVLFYDSDGFLFLKFFLLIVIGIYTFGFYFWWRHHTTALYQQRIKERDIAGYIAEIGDNKNQIASLSESNDFLSETVHKDNKLIPAMYNSVSRFLDSHDKEIDTEVKNKGLSILAELDEIMRERKNMILEAQKKNKALPPTGLERIDNILNYMFSKATENEIQFDFVLSEDIKEVAESAIPSGKLGTLLADLIENAIIAVSYSKSEHKKILVEMGMMDSCYEITVQDSGIPFEVETLANLGLKKSTTHADTGGSGIGYMAIFEILKECGASLTITEYAPENYVFTKVVKIRFDGKSEYIINSFRASEIKVATEREDMLIVENQ